MCIRDSTMPSRRLNNVAAAIAPDDFNICDIARRLKSKAQSPKSKVHRDDFVLVIGIEMSRTRKRRRTRRIQLAFGICAAAI